jgi:hypothetical protein
MCLFDVLKPEDGFVGLFNDKSELGDKLGPRSGAAGRTIVCSRRRRASIQLIGRVSTAGNRPHTRRYSLDLDGESEAAVLEFIFIHAHHGARSMPTGSSRESDWTLKSVRKVCDSSNVGV